MTDLYLPQTVPPQASKQFFIVFVECGMFTYVKDKIFTDYNEATKSKESCGMGVSDSFVSGYSTEKDAEIELAQYKKW